MNKLFLLLKLRAEDQFRFSVVKHEKDPKRRAFRLTLSGLRLLFGVLLYLLLLALSKKLSDLGYGAMLPTTGYVLASVVTFVMTILKMNETISGTRDAEFLLSTPISSYAQAMMTFLSLYLKSLVYTFLLASPMTIVYGLQTNVAGTYWVYSIVGFFFICMPVAGIATLLGLVLALILSTSTRSNEIQSLFSVLATAGAVGLVLLILDKLGNILKNGVSFSPAEQAQQMVDVLCANYKFARFYQHGVVEGQVGWFVLFLLISFLWYGFFLLLLTMGYRDILIALRCPVDYHLYEWKEQKQIPVKTALFRREVKQFLHSKSYLISSMLGVILGILIPLNLVLVTGVDFFARFHLEAFYPRVQAAIPAMVCFFVGLSCTSYCSMTMEGRHHWIMETTPMETSIIRASKLKLNLLITVPLAVISAVLFLVACRPSALVVVLSLLIPVLYAVLTAWGGSVIGEKYADFSVDSEQQAMHWGAPFLLGYLPGILLPFLVTLLVFLV